MVFVYMSVGKTFFFRLVTKLGVITEKDGLHYSHVCLAIYGNLGLNVLWEFPFFFFNT